MYSAVRFFKLVLFALFYLPGILAAQPNDSTAPRQEPKNENFNSQAVQSTATKSRVGDFLVSPYLQVGPVFDNNIFATPIKEIDDMITVINASVNLNSDWQQHKLNVDAWGAIGRYREYDTENYEDYGLNGDFRYDLAANSNVFGGLGYQMLHEARSSQENLQGLTPTTYSLTDAVLGMSHSFSKLWTRLGLTRDVFDFDDTDALFGIINKDDRDRKMDAAGIRLGYPVTKTVNIFGQATYDQREYDETPDDNGYVRNSDGSRVAAGLIIRPTKGLNMEFLIGSLNQKYEDQRFSDVSVPDFGIDLVWLPSSSSRFTLLLDRRLEETTLAGASGFLNDMISARYNQQLPYNLSISAFGALSNHDYQGIERKDDLVSVGLGAKYAFSKLFFLALDYSFLSRDSNDDLANYDQNNLFLSVGFEPQD